MPTPFDHVAAYHCDVGLLVGGYQVHVTHLEQRLTYAGLLEGVPSARENDRLLEPHRRAAASPGTYLVEPSRRDYLRRPGDMESIRRHLPSRVPEWLPMVLVAMTLEGPGLRDPAGGRTSLRIVFFQSAFAPPLDDDVAAVLRQLDWARHAEEAER
jgi:hypothetical protein